MLPASVDQPLQNFCALCCIIARFFGQRHDEVRSHFTHLAENIVRFSLKHLQKRPIFVASHIIARFPTIWGSHRLQSGL